MRRTFTGGPVNMRPLAKDTRGFEGLQLGEFFFGCIMSLISNEQSSPIHSKRPFADIKFGFQHSSAALHVMWHWPSIFEHHTPEPSSHAASYRMKPTGKQLDPEQRFDRAKCCVRYQASYLPFDSRDRSGILARLWHRAFDEFWLAHLR